MVNVNESVSMYISMYILSTKILSFAIAHNIFVYIHTYILKLKPFLRVHPSKRLNYFYDNFLYCYPNINEKWCSF